MMYVGGFSVTHDVSTILKAAKILEGQGKGDDFNFIIVGDGRQRSDCEREAKDLGLKNVAFRDSVPKVEVASLQTRADVLIASVKDTPVYQFGINSNKLYDYLASPRPIIFSGNAPNDPIAESGAGYSITPENPDAMAEALTQLLHMKPEFRVKLGTTGREYVHKEFDQSKLALRMESLLMQAIQDKETSKCS